MTGGKDAEFSSGYSIESDFLISAVGQLNQPRYPDIEGLDDFKGKIIHSARWDWSYDMTDKKIGIIGNGMSITSLFRNEYSLIVSQEPPPHKSSPKSSPSPKISQSTNAPPTGSSPAKTAPSPTCAAQSTATYLPCAGASAPA